MRNPPSPIAAPPNQSGQFLQPLPVDVVEAVSGDAVDIEDGDQPLVAALVSRGGEDGDDDLAPGVAVAGDVAGEGVDVGDELGASVGSGGAADAPAEGDGLAGYLALEGA